MGRPTFVINDHLEFLDRLHESGETNMYRATPYLEAEFGLIRPVAREILIYWRKALGNKQR